MNYFDLNISFDVRKDPELTPEDINKIEKAFSILMLAETNYPDKVGLFLQPDWIYMFSYYLETKIIGFSYTAKKVYKYLSEVYTGDVCDDVEYLHLDQQPAPGKVWVLYPQYSFVWSESRPDGGYLFELN